MQHPRSCVSVNAENVNDEVDDSDDNDNDDYDDDNGMVLHLVGLKQLAQQLLPLFLPVILCCSIPGISILLFFLFFMFFCAPLGKNCIY